MIKLFLLKPGFTNPKLDSNGLHYYCQQCAMIEGVLKYYPEIKDKLEIHYVDFPRPRPAIIDLIGQENQNCPTLIIDKKNDTVDTSYFKSFGDKLFVNTPELIAKYLGEKFKVALPHP